MFLEKENCMVLYFVLFFFHFLSIEIHFHYILEMHCLQQIVNLQTHTHTLTDTSFTTGNLRNTELDNL